MLNESKNEADTFISNCIDVERRTDLVIAARKALKPWIFENAYPEMIPFHQWVLWRYELTDKGKLTKVPYSIGKSDKLYKVSVTDSQNWVLFEDAKAAYESGKYDVDGVGFVFTENDPFTVADFDHVIDPVTNKPDTIALTEASALNSRVELSPSGTGWHCIFKGKMPKPGKKKNLEDGTGREIYCDKRYMTMTFDVPSEFPKQINNSEAEGLQLFTKYWPDVDEPRKTDQRTKSSVSAFNIPESFVNNSNSLLKGLHPAKDQIIDLCRHAPGSFGERFNRLFTGNIPKYKSKSEADMAIAGMIAFHTSDYSIIKGIIQESALWDQKWERNDYCQRTIMTAIRNRGS